MSNWTDERVERLKTMWVAGKSASAIAFELGGVSRNSVIGKVHRLGLPQQAGKEGAKRAKKPDGRSNGGAAAAVRIHRMTCAPPNQPAEMPPLESDAAIPQGQRKTLVELKHDSCRWPVGTPGTPGFFFCGGETSARPWGQSACPYCDWHADRAISKRAA